MLKFVCLLLMLLMTSGCCQLFGLCTSVNVHTSASSPDKFASSDLYDGFGSISFMGSTSIRGIRRAASQRGGHQFALFILRLRAISGLQQTRISGQWLQGAARGRRTGAAVMARAA